MAGSNPNFFSTLTAFDVMASRRASQFQGGELVVMMKNSRMSVAPGPEHAYILLPDESSKKPVSTTCLTAQAVKGNTKGKGGVDVSKKCEERPPMADVTRPRSYATAVDMFQDIKNHKKKLLAQIRGDCLCNKRQQWGAKFPSQLSKLPVQSIVIRWRMIHNLPCYTVEAVYNILDRYGTIESIGKLSTNSVVVVFSRLVVAARVVRHLRTEKRHPCPLLAEWWYTSMNNHDVLEREMANQVQNRIQTLPREVVKYMKWKKMQEKVFDLIKIAEPMMHYDKANFIP